LYILYLNDIVKTQFLRFQASEMNGIGGEKIFWVYFAKGKVANLSFLRADANFMLVLLDAETKSAKIQLWNGAGFSKTTSTWKSDDKVLTPSTLRRPEISFGGQTLSVALFHVIISLSRISLVYLKKISGSSFCNFGECRRIGFFWSVRWRGARVVGRVVDGAAEKPQLLVQFLQSLETRGRRRRFQKGRRGARFGKGGRGPRTLPPPLRRLPTSRIHLPHHHTWVNQIFKIPKV